MNWRRQIQFPRSHPSRTLFHPRRIKPQLNVLLAIFRFSSKSITNNHPVTCGGKLLTILDQIPCQSTDHSDWTTQWPPNGICGFGWIFIIGKFRGQCVLHQKLTVLGQRRVTSHCPVIHHRRRGPGGLCGGLFGQSIHPPKRIPCCDYYSESVVNSVGSADSRRLGFLRNCHIHNTAPGRSILSRPIFHGIMNVVLWIIL